MAKPDVTLTKPVIQECVACKRIHRVGELMCPHCGYVASTVGKTRKVGDINVIDDDKGWSRQVQNFTDVTIILDIEGKQLALPTAQSLILGRGHDGFCPDIDLNPYGAEDKGVSRQHLRISRDALIYVADLGSTNGTFLNGQKLFRNTDCPLTNGDVLRIGQLHVKVQFFSL